MKKEHADQENSMTHSVNTFLPVNICFSGPTMRWIIKNPLTTVFASVISISIFRRLLNRIQNS